MQVDRFILLWDGSFNPKSTAFYPTGSIKEPKGAVFSWGYAAEFLGNFQTLGVFENGGNAKGNC